MRYYLIVLLLAFLSVIRVYAGEQKVAYTALVDSDGVQRVELLAGSYFFRPEHIIAKVNVPMELSIKKETGLTPHTFVIKEPEAGIDLNESLSSEPKIIRFVPKKAGRYQFYCGRRLLFFESHREKGMEGIFEVIE